MLGAAFIQQVNAERGAGIALPAPGNSFFEHGHNLKVQSDVAYTPAAAFTSATGSTLANTQDLIFRDQLQLKF